MSYKFVPASEDATRGDKDGFPENRSEYAVLWPEQKAQKSKIIREYANDSADDVSNFRPPALPA